jgi:hypothetical protein
MGDDIFPQRLDPPDFLGPCIAALKRCATQNRMTVKPNLL